MGFRHFSYCSQHPWRKTSYDPNRHSIFAVEVESEEDESAGDTDDEIVQDASRRNQPLNQITSVSSGVTDLYLTEDDNCPGGSGGTLLAETPADNTVMYSCGKNSRGCDCDVEDRTQKNWPENTMSFCDGCTQCAGEAGCVRHFYPVRASQSYSSDNNNDVEDSITKG